MCERCADVRAARYKAVRVAVDRRCGVVAVLRDWDKEKADAEAKAQQEAAAKKKKDEAEAVRLKAEEDAKAAQEAEEAEAARLKEEEEEERQRQEAEAVRAKEEEDEAKAAVAKILENYRSRKNYEDLFSRPLEEIDEDDEREAPRGLEGDVEASDQYDDLGDGDRGALTR